MYCDGCGVRLDSEARFCGACGTVAPEAIASPAACACGAGLEPGSRFCERCGLPVLAPARPVAGGVADARLSVPGGGALPHAGARVLGPSRLKKRQSGRRQQSAPARTGMDPDEITSVTANVPINTSPSDGRRPPELPQVAVPPAVAKEPVVSAPVEARRGGPAVQVAGAAPGAAGPSPLVLAVIFVGSFLAVTGGLVAAYSRALPVPANGTRSGVPTPAAPQANVIPAAEEMLRGVRVLQIAAEKRAPGLTASLSFDPAGDFVAACSRDGVLRIWSIVAEKEIHPPKGAVSAGKLVGASAFSPEGGLLAVAEAGPPAQVSVFSLSGKKPPLKIPMAASPVAIGLLAGGRLRVVTRNGSLQTWNVRTGESDQGLRLVPWNGEDSLPEVVALSSDGAWLARASGSGADVWDVESGGLPSRVEMPGRPSSLAFRGDGKHLAAAVSGEIGIWSTVSGKRVRSFEGHRYSVSAVAFSPDGRLLGSVAESEVAIWDVLSGRMRDRLSLPGETFRSVGFNGPGSWLGTGSDDRIRLYRFR